MKKNVFIGVIIILMLQIVTNAQNQVPSALKSAIPERYVIANELYSKSDFIVNIDFSFELPSKYSCFDNLKEPVSVGIGIYIIERADIAKIQEDMMPSSNYFPTKDSHKPQIDTWDELVKYTETKIFDLPEGQAAYYTWVHQCIQAQYDNYQGVSLAAVSGNHSLRISIDVNGNIDASEAIAITKELHSILSKFDFQNL
jgi:hypothetical protein